MNALSRQWERVRSSLFLVPLVFALAAGAAAEGLLELDRRVEEIPDRITSTVDSARAVLGLVAGATLTFAAIAFSVSLLLISAASSQFSPRVVHGLFRDPFNKRIMGIVVGTFVYCLVVIRAVRSPLEDAGEAVIPSLAVLVGGLLGVVAILSIVAFINHAAHSMEVSTMLDRVVDEALGQIDQQRPEPVGRTITLPATFQLTEPVLEVTFAEHGWVQTVHHRQLLAAVPDGATIVLETTAGRYAIADTVVARVSPRPARAEEVATEIRKAISIGASRTLQQDETFGVRQLADVALKAMSPGINDPTTAQDALFHMGSVLSALLQQPEVPEAQLDESNRTLILRQRVTPQEMVGVAFNEIRLVSADQPTVLIYLLEVIRLVKESLPAGERPEAVAALDRQADLIAELAAGADAQEPDRQSVREVHASKFSDH